MIKKTIFEYYWFGTCLRFLQDVVGGVSIHDKKDSWFVLTNLRSFFNYLDKLNLQVTKRAANKLHDIMTNFEGAAKGAILTDDQATELVGEMTQIRRTLEAEIEGLKAYVISPKRFNVQSLMENMNELFAPGVFNVLPDIARYDLSEVGKCIAFERPTAAAFHLLRATECVLRQFYCGLVQRQRCDLMWGPMVSDLRKKRRAKKYEVLLNHMDNIRISFRNPTQHPDKIYDIHEVQDLFGVCVDTINRMAKP